VALLLARAGFLTRPFLAPALLAPELALAAAPKRAVAAEMAATSEVPPPPRANASGAEYSVPIETAAISATTELRIMIALFWRPNPERVPR
jgi:hypothetical protein